MKKIELELKKLKRPKIIANTIKESFIPVECFRLI